MGLPYVLLVETNLFLELVVILPDYMLFEHLSVLSRFSLVWYFSVQYV